MTLPGPNPSAHAEVHITSLIIHTFPDRKQTVTARLLEMPEVEIHCADDRGKLVVIMETHSLLNVSERVEDMRSIDGVVNVTLVYHQIEDGALLDQPVDASPLPVDPKLKEENA